MKNNKFSLLTGVLLGLLPMASAQAEFYSHAWQLQHEAKKQFRLNLEGAYLSTDTNFDAVGSLFLPKGLTSYQRYSTDLSGALGITERLTAFGRLNWSAVLLNHESRSGSSYGLGDQTLGASYRILDAPDAGILTAIDLQAQVDFPAYNNVSAKLNLTPLLGDQSVDITAGAFATVRLHQNRKAALAAKVGAGYTRRDENFSSAIPWSAALQYESGQPGFSGSLGIYGVTSLKTDSRGDTVPLDSSTHAIGTGGSFMSTAYNPSHASIRGDLTWENQHGLGFNVFATKTLSGYSAPSFVAAGGGVQLRLGDARPRKDLRELTPSEYGKSNQGLVTYAMEAKVTRVNDRLNLLKIDKGSDDGVQVGQIFDIFRTTDGRTAIEAIARTKVVSRKNNEAALEITEYFKEVWIEEGFIAKHPLQ